MAEYAFAIPPFSGWSVLGIVEAARGRKAGGVRTRIMVQTPQGPKSERALRQRNYARARSENGKFVVPDLSPRARDFHKPQVHCKLGCDEGCQTHRHIRCARSKKF